MMFKFRVNGLLKRFAKLKEQAAVAVKEREDEIKRLDEIRSTLINEKGIATNIKNMLDQLEIGKAQ